MMCDKINDVHFCDYGCGNIAQYQLKNGKWCCSKNYQSCSILRKNISEKLKEDYKNGRISGLFGKENKNKSKTFEEIFGIERSNEIKNKLSVKNKGNHSIGRCKDKIKEQERRKKISITMKGNNNCQKGSGKGKKGWYKGYWCDSSWELAYVIYNIEHDIKFTRNNEGFEYLYNNKTYKYYPDFILEDGTYVEIKGYMDKRSITKIASFNKSLIVLVKKDMQLYIDYVENKYGKNFIELYESNPYKNNKCPICGLVILRGSKSCRHCFNSIINKKEFIPKFSKELLEEYLKEMPMSDVVSKLNTSVKYIKKCIKHYGLTYERNIGEIIERKNK